MCCLSWPVGRMPGYTALQPRAMQLSIHIHDRWPGQRPRMSQHLRYDGTYFTCRGRTKNPHKHSCSLPSPCMWERGRHSLTRTTIVDTTNWVSVIHAQSDINYPQSCTYWNSSQPQFEPQGIQVGDPALQETHQIRTRRRQPRTPFKAICIKSRTRSESTIKFC